VTRRSRNSRWEGGLVLVDPSIDGSDLNELAGDLGRLVVLVPATAPLPRVPRWLPASPLIMPTSTRYGEEGEPIDARLDQDWLSGPHQSNLEQARHSSG